MTVFFFLLYCFVFIFIYFCISVAVKARRGFDTSGGVISFVFLCHVYCCELYFEATGILGVRVGVFLHCASLADSSMRGERGVVRDECQNKKGGEIVRDWGKK